MELSTKQEEKEYNESAAQRMGDIDIRYIITLCNIFTITMIIVD